MVCYDQRNLANVCISMPFCNHIILSVSNGDSINTKEIVRKLTTGKAGLHATNKACIDITIAIKEMEPCS